VNTIKCGQLLDQLSNRWLQKYDSFHQLGKFTGYVCEKSAVGLTASSLDSVGWKTPMNLSFSIVEINAAYEEWCLLGCYAVWLL
jgi:hypothetical protein